ncbi:Iron-sulfur cluster assembly accessory protein [Aromatoleum tolulyticum]|uniref:Iron-sulfur cluster assembly accessory protein n=1 Tax=Aromatoleum tolulyticum TaxID=34027 RepID=A0A1N7B5H8_9RHOO|nr:iron-sulfur cluster assembly accessory protein [Aromatoleum tolulyticum]SIR46548.1 Iron-sulfur cluster assembly accessory protein [Aromatoleum tolulyticum]
MNISITPAAEKFMRRMVRFGGGGPDAGFRLQVTAGGCSGYASEFNVEPPRAGDATLDWNGLTLILPTESRLLLEGVTIDFADTPMSSGLTFINPNAASCGCSTSAPSGPAGVAAISIDSIRRKA